jgi:hypothetical protein
MRLLAAHARDRGPAAGHPSLVKLAQGTVCKILAKLCYYLEKRDTIVWATKAKTRRRQFLCYRG